MYSLGYMWTRLTRAAHGVLLSQGTLMQARQVFQQLAAAQQGTPYASSSAKSLTWQLPPA